VQSSSDGSTNSNAAHRPRVRTGYTWARSCSDSPTSAASSWEISPGERSATTTSRDSMAVAKAGANCNWISFRPPGCRRFVEPARAFGDHRSQPDAKQQHRRSMARRHPAAQRPFAGGLGLASRRTDWLTCARPSGVRRGRGRRRPPPRARPPDDRTPVQGARQLRETLFKYPANLSRQPAFSCSSTRSV